MPKLSQIYAKNKKGRQKRNYYRLPGQYEDGSDALAPATITNIAGDIKNRKRIKRGRLHPWER